jgi:lipopolysaccharide export system permease protein
MRLLRNYLLNEFILPLLLGLLVLTFVLLLGNLIKIADMVINKGVDILSVTKLFLFMIPYLLTYTLPIATLVAVLLSLGRLSSDNEIIAIRASGIGIFKIISPILVISVMLSLLLIIFNDRLIPYAHFATRKTLMEVGLKNPTAALEPGVFINSFDKYILFIYSIEGNKLNNIRIYEPQGDNKPARIIIAKKGEFIALPDRNMIKLKLIDGTADEPDPNNSSNFYKLNFKNYFMVLNLSQLQNKGKIEKKPKDMTIKELQHEANLLEKQGIVPTPLLCEINRKISLAFSCVIFTLLGLPMAIITRRREKSINFGIAFVIVIVYYLLLLGSEALSPQGYLDPQLTLWLPNIILGTIGALLTYRLCAY